MKSITVVIFLISSVALASADYVPKWNTSCLLAANVSTNIWQPTSVSVSTTPSPSSMVNRLTVCGVANQDFIADHLNTTGFYIVSGTTICLKGAPYWRTNKIWTQRSATAGNEWCSDFFTSKASINIKLYTSFLTTIILNDSQNRNLGCFTIFDSLDDNLDSECSASIFI